MEEKIRNVWNLDKGNLKDFSPLSLAYIGDSVYELIVRTISIDEKKRNIKELHNISSGYSNAHSQALVFNSIKELLTEDEKNIFRRARNAHKGSKAKNQSIADYHKATGLEALIGYLYLSNDMDRIFYLIKYGFDKL